MSNSDITFTFNGRSSDAYFFVQNVNRSLLPTINSRLVHIPNRNSPYDFGSEFTKRELTIDVVYIGTDFTNLRAVVREIAKWLNPLSGAKPLIISDEPNMTYQAKLTGDTDIEQIITIGKGTLTFECVNLFPEGQEQVQTIAGIPREEKDIRTLAEFQDVISASNIQYTHDGVLLDKEGVNYTKNQDDFTNGTYDRTTTNANHDLLLDSAQTPHHDLYPIDYTTGTLNGLIYDPFLNVLVMNNLPDFHSNFLDEMNSVDTVNTWQTYTDPADPGTVTFTQNDGYYTMSALNMDGALRQMTGNFRFPITVDFVYRLRAVNSGQSNPVRVDARVVYGGVLFAAQLSDTGGAWRMGRIVIHSSTQAGFYINGIRQGNISPFNSGLSDRVQFFTDQAWQAAFDLAYFGMVNEARTTYQQSSYPFPTVATYTSNEITLDGTSDVYNTSIITFTTAKGTIDSFDSKVVVEADVFKDGSWQGYQPISSGGSLPHLELGDDLAGVRARIKVTLSAYGVEDGTPNITPIELSVNGQVSSYQMNGSFVAEADTGIQQVGKASETVITWEDVTPVGTAITCAVSLDGGATYQVVNKGDPIPNITPTTDLSISDLRIKFDLSTDDPTQTPKVLSYRYQLTSAFVDEGERIGSEHLDLSKLKSIGESYMGWDGTPDETPNIEVYVNLTDQSIPTGSWIQVNNGESIRGILEGDETLLNKKVFVRQLLKSPNKTSSPILHRLSFWVAAQGGSQIIYMGTADSYPVITVHFLEDIDFNRQPFSIVHLQTGNRLLFNANFQAGMDVLEINCITGSVKRNGVHAMYLLSIQSDFLYFVEGINDFTITPESAASIEFKWKERFL